MYKLVCNNLEVKEAYVGSTTNFRKRKNGHKSDCCNEKGKSYNYEVYQFIRANGGWSNWSILEIEKFPCTDSNEALTRERYWIETLNATLNSQVPSRCPIESNLNWYNTNLERLHKKHICDCGGHYLFTNKLRHSKQAIHLAYLKNPEIPQKIIKDGITCSCGGKYTTKGKIQHCKTKKHLAYLENIQSQSLAI